MATRLWVLTTSEQHTADERDQPEQETNLRIVIPAVYVFDGARHRRLCYSPFPLTIGHPTDRAFGGLTFLPPRILGAIRPAPPLSSVFPGNPPRLASQSSKGQ